ncbi:hypothetical protein HYH03_015695 [Edaphochlamys debaryana]|uniref:Glycosyltransferase 61 catalytic domain-containing protein n=1 Tax=Edaphochlamys debaryana TaxID=47281 RepID=A0A836BQZ0_9CHLO|nr:hypothetical protein HYH03_015695 [Edaphochlamys debaryana]|eukprot:KAG2485635.1 hypothetical protein HYH03_015695 [Edaphochlamys debaryana]
MAKNITAFSRALWLGLLLHLLPAGFRVRGATQDSDNSFGFNDQQHSSRRLRGWWPDEEPDFKFRGDEWHPKSYGYTDCKAPDPVINEDGNIFDCPILRDVCLDQGTIIFQDRRFHPWTSEVRLPYFNITDILWNTPSVLGIGDKWKIGKQRYLPPHVRPWHHMEGSPDVQKPVFSNCTTPLLFYHHFPFNVAEVYRFAVNNIYFMQQHLKFFDEHITLVPANPYMSRIPPYTQFWLQPFSKYQVTDLGSLSQRREPGSPSNSTGEGQAVRCFSKFIMCKITLKKPTGAYFEAGQFVAEYYAKKAAPLQDEFTARLAPLLSPEELHDAGVMKVVFAVRSISHKDIGRMLLNEDELIDRCNKQEAALPDDPNFTIYRSMRCIRHVFGVDNLYDMWLVRHMDVLVGLHGSALTNAMFMRKGSSLIELRPFQFSGRESWPNIYMKSQTRRMEVFWFGIDVMNGSLSAPGEFESDMQPIYTRARGCIARDRSTAVPWAAFRNQLLNVAVVSRSVWRYKVLRYSHAYYTTDNLEALEVPGKEKFIPPELLTWFQDLDAERTRAAAIPLTPEGEERARAAEESLLASIAAKRAAEEAARAEAAEVEAGHREGDGTGPGGAGGEGAEGVEGGEGGAGEGGMEALVAEPDPGARVAAERSRRRHRVQQAMARARAARAERAHSGAMSGFIAARARFGAGVHAAANALGLGRGHAGAQAQGEAGQGQEAEVQGQEGAQAEGQGQEAAAQGQDAGGAAATAAGGAEGAGAGGGQTAKEEPQGEAAAQGAEGAAQAA